MIYAAIGATMGIVTRIVVEHGDEIRCYRDADGYLRRTIVKSNKTAS